MDLYDKIIFINVVVMFSVIFMDRHLLENPMIDGKAGDALSVWCGITLISIPSWIIYAIIWRF